MRFVRLSVVASICLAAVLFTGLKVGDPPGVQMRSFADSFLGSLDEDQKKKAMMPYDSESEPIGISFPKMYARVWRCVI